MTALPMPRNPKHDVQAILELHEQGLSPREISKKIGIPRSTIDHYVWASGKSRPRGRALTMLDDNGILVKLCVICGMHKPATAIYFPPHKGGYEGLDGSCRDCAHKRDAGKWERTKATDAKRGKRWREELKRKVIGYYSNGTCACACCGENHMEFLAIDHINGGGNKHRREINKTGLGFYRWLCENNFPEGYRVLCHNCNFAIGHCGKCPHQEFEADTRQVALEAEHV